MRRVLGPMLSAFVLLGGCTEISQYPAAMRAGGAGGSGAAGAGAGGSAGAEPRAGEGAGAGGAGAAGVGGELGAPMGPVDGIAMLGTACTLEPGKACVARESMTPLVCTAGRWTEAATCAPSERCDTSQGMTLGTCRPALLLCTDKKAGDQVCDGFRRRRCGRDLLRFDADECPENSHCTGAAASCTCDVGYKDDGAGACVSDVQCPAMACMPGGRCVVSGSSFHCECDVEYEGTGSKACVPTGRCAQPNVCLGEYACRSRDMSYVCRGQFADWPMPSSVAGAKVAPSYMPSAETVKDNVTGLTWQRNLPETYAGCTARCTWMNAGAYCDKLELEGISDWRLPTLIELVSILNDTGVVPAVDPSVFPNTPPEMFWTSSGLASASDQAWVVDFNLFGTNALPRTNSQRVRCVR